MDKTIGADEYVLSNEDQDNDPVYGAIRQGRKASRVDHESGELWSQRRSELYTVSVAGYQSVYNADIGSPLIFVLGARG